jgi:hypothetical protein
MMRRHKQPVQFSFFTKWIGTIVDLNSGAFRTPGVAEKIKQTKLLLESVQREPDVWTGHHFYFSNSISGLHANIHPYHLSTAILKTQNGINKRIYLTSFNLPILLSSAVKPLRQTVLMPLISLPFRCLDYPKSNS